MRSKNELYSIEQIAESSAAMNGAERFVSIYNSQEMPPGLSMMTGKMTGKNSREGLSVPKSKPSGVMGDTLQACPSG
jgi:hypothetical protein